MAIIDAFLLGFMQRALAAGILVSVASAVIGSFLILRGMSLLGDSLAHASFGGIALGLLLGFSPFYMALVFAVLGGIAVHVLEHRRILRGDTSVGIVFAAGLGVGVIIVSIAGGFNVSLLAFLFGSLLAVTWTDVALFAVLVSLLLTVVVGFYKEYLYMTFDEETAEASGLPVHALNILFAVLTAVAVVVSIKIVGVLLVSALLVVPAASSQQVARSFRQSLTLAVAFAVTSMVGGILLSYISDWPPGGSVVVVSLLLFVLVVTAKHSWSWILEGPSG